MNGQVSVFGNVSILNVGEGDTKLSFDKNDPAEVIRARRIVKDMLRRGYALLIEVTRDGEKSMERVLDFDEDHDEYIIADFDPRAEESVEKQSPDVKNDSQLPDSSKSASKKTHKSSNKSRKARIPVNKTKGIAVAPTAGG